MLEGGRCRIIFLDLDLDTVSDTVSDTYVSDTVSEVKGVELPSRCVVLGSWSNYFFGCCLVNSCGGLIR